MMPVSPAWPVAAERIQERETVGGGLWRAGNGPPGGKARRSQQSLGRTSGPQRSRRRDTRRRLPPAHPTPEGAHYLGAGSHPLPSLRLCFRQVSGTHFLFHLSDSIMPPCNFRLGLLCLPSPHFSLWPQSSFFLANKIWSAGRVDCIKVKDLPLRSSNIYSYCHASLLIFFNLI